MTSAHVTFLSSGVDRGPIADAAGLEDEVRSSSSASGAKELDVARGTTIALGVDGVPSALRASVEVPDTSQKHYVWVKSYHLSSSKISNAQ